MKILFLCGGLEPGRDGVGDYTRRLAGACIRAGHECEILALNDRYAPPPEGIDPFAPSVQETGGTPVVVRRFSSALPWNLRIRAASAHRAAFAADWVSLQFVPYAYHPKGLPYRLASDMRILLGRHSGPPKLHVMFHELWLGMAMDAGMEDRVIGWLQRGIVRDLVSKLRPQALSTQSVCYQRHLEASGIMVSRLPLFGNIEVNGDEENGLAPEVRAALEKFACSMVVFGTVHPEWCPRDLCDHAHRWGWNQDGGLALVFAGRSGRPSDYFNRLRGTLPKVEVISLGELSEAAVSQLFRGARLGVATTPWALVEKSGSVAAMVEHGLPVVVTRDDWQTKLPGAVPEPGPEVKPLDLLGSSLPQRHEIRERLDVVAATFLQQLPA